MRPKACWQRSAVEWEKFLSLDGWVTRWVAHLFRGGRHESVADSRPPRLKPLATQRLVGGAHPTVLGDAQVARLFRGGGHKWVADSRPPRLKPWATRPHG